MVLGKRRRSNAGLRALAGAAGSIAGQFMAGGSSTVSGTKDRVRHTTTVSRGSSYSAFEHIRTNHVPTKFIGSQPYIYRREYRQSIANAARLQKSFDIMYLWSAEDMLELLNANPVITADVASNAYMNTMDYFISKAKSQTLFANAGNCTAHVVLYNVRSRNSCLPTMAPEVAFETGVDNLLAATGTGETVWGMVPEMSKTFKENFEVLNKEAFSLESGEEHLHTWNIKQNKVFNVSQFQTSAAGAITATGTLAGYTYHLFMIVFGGLVAEDGTPANSAIGECRVNTLSNVSYHTRWAASNDVKTLYQAATAQSTITTPKKFNDADAEVAVTQI